jgi:extracellular elastinolytic metalloproteinase
LAQEPTSYQLAAVTNLFYHNNIIHDVFYQYGFDELSGNFQTDNYGKGGLGNDHVIANAQAPGKNNANFATPPDGQNGRMNMFTWSLTNPERDGDLENDIIMHEYAHGISNRLTGGPANSNCLGFGEPGGMGEGWGDWFSLIMRLKGRETPSTELGVGNYVYSKTIRKYVYSTSQTTNPTSYQTLNEPAFGQVHAIGEVWANMLYEVYWSIMEAVGKFEPNLYSASKEAANTIALQIVVDGMKMQPCNPTFLQARKAIVDAAAKISAKVECAVWKGFAKRGLGENAAVVAAKRVNGNAVPAKCVRI